MKTWLLLLLAVLCETFGTSMLKLSNEFTRLLPSLGVIVGFGAAFYLLSLTLKVLPLGVMYAVWSGVGIVLTTLIGWIVFGQRLDAGTLAGIVLIVLGVVVINLFSTSAAH